MNLNHANLNNQADTHIQIENMDTYIIKAAIKRTLADSLSQFHGNLLDVGCGKMPYREYILTNSQVDRYHGLDIETAFEYDKDIKPDFLWNGNSMPFDDNSYDDAIATEVLEHCPEPEVVLKETLRVLKPGGKFFFTVPFLWNLHEVPFDEYRYTPFSLKRHLKNSGFTDVEIKATGGWHLAMAQMIGLWCRRSPMPYRLRPLVSLVAKWVMVILIKIGRKEIVSFKEGQMITGLYGSATKPLVNFVK